MKNCFASKRFFNFVMQQTEYWSSKYEFKRYVKRVVFTIESVMSMVGQYTDKVDYWKNSSQKHRWIASALLEIEPRLRRIKGYRYLPLLKLALKQNLQLIKEAAWGSHATPIFSIKNRIDSKPDYKTKSNSFLPGVPKSTQNILSNSRQEFNLLRTENLDHFR